MKKLVYSLMVLSLTACGGGQAGKDGNSCSVVTNADGTATIKCTDGSNFDIVNGKDGDAGSDGNSCQVITNQDGSGKVVCTDGSSYSISSTNRPTSEGYDHCLPGYFGPDCRPCTCNREHGTCNDTTQGDGKCYDCNYGWIGENCDVKASCVNGTAKSGPTADGKCSSCNPGWSGDNCTEIASGYGSVTDGDNNIYPTVIINNQEWYAANSKYRGNNVTCYANSDYPRFVEEYGCLYTWEDAMKVCPAGWKLPEQEDFEQLLTTTGADSDSSSIRASSWANGSDSSGFGALPAGFYDSGYYDDFGTYGYFWSSTERSSSSAYYLYLGLGYADVYFSDETRGHSVRCLKDSN